MPSLPPVAERTLTRTFARALEQVPDKVAVIDSDGQEWTYTKTRDRALQAAGGLFALGIRPQQTVALMLDNSYDFLGAGFGLGLTRRVQVPVTTAYKGQFLAHGITETVMLGAVAELLQQADPEPNDADKPLALAVTAPLTSGMDHFRKRFGIGVDAVYGMSEIGSVMFSDSDEAVPGEAGKSRDGYQLRLVDDLGNDVADGVAGELWGKPDSPLRVMRGYHGLPDKTAETLVEVGSTPVTS